MCPKVQILLATYNGSEFIGEQLASLVEQTFTDFELLVSDDGSSDDTLQIVHSFSDRLPIRVLGKPATVVPAGVKNNFQFLIHSSSASLLAFCDQDDIWDREKLARQVAFSEQPTNSSGLLFYCDARIVNASGRVTARSFFEDARKDPNRNRLNQILVENVVSGNMSLARGDFARAAMPIANESPGHDWWLAAIAANSEGLRYLPEQLLSYRQHSHNAIGAPGLSIRHILDEARTVTSRDRRHRRIVHKIEQAQSIALALDDNSGVAAALGSLDSLTKMNRIRTLIRWRLWHGNTIRNIGFLLLI